MYSSAVNSGSLTAESGFKRGGTLRTGDHSTSTSMPPSHRATRLSLNQDANWCDSWLGTAANAHVITTFLARVLNRSPLARTTVTDTNPVLPVLMSLTVPDFPTWTPPTTLQCAPSVTGRGSADFFIGCVIRDETEGAHGR